MAGLLVGTVEGTRDLVRDERRRDAWEEKGISVGYMV